MLNPAVTENLDFLLALLAGSEETPAKKNLADRLREIREALQ